MGFTSALALIGIVTTVVQAVKRAKEEAIQNAQANADEYADQAKSISEYKKEVEDLTTSIQSGNLTHEEAYEARKRLREIEYEVYNQYGGTAGEAADMDLLTGSVESAANAFERLAEAQAKVYLESNESNIDTAFGKITGAKDAVARGLNWHAMSDRQQSQISGAVSKYANAVLESYYDQAEGAELYRIRVTGSAYEIQETLTSLQADLSNVDLSNVFVVGASGAQTFGEEIANEVNRVSGIIDEHGKQYTEGVNAKITANESYRNTLSSLKEAESEYANATTRSFDSNEDKIIALQKAYNAAVKATDGYEAMAAKIPEEDTAVKNYMDDYYDSLQAHEKQLNFELNVAMSVDKDGLKQGAESTVAEVMTYLDEFKDENGDIWSADVLGSTENLTFDTWKDLPIEELNEAQVAIKELYTVANEQGFSGLEGLLSVLREYSLVIGTTSQQLGDAKRAFSSFSAETEVINNALKSQANGNSVSLEQYEALIKANSEYATCLESNAGVLMFNAEAVQKVNEKKRQEQEQVIATNKAYAQMRYSEVTAELTSHRNALEDLRIEGRDNVSGIEDQIKALESEGTELLDAINKYNLMAAAIREATSARAAWINSKDDQQPGDSFSDAADAYSHLWEVLNGNTPTRGDVGTSTYKAALDYLIPTDKILEGEQAIRKYMRSLQEILKIDGKGKISDIRMDNIIKKLSQGEDAILEKGADGNWLVKEGKTLDDFAKKLGITKDLARDVIGMINRNSSTKLNIEDDEMESYVKKLDDAKTAQKELADSGVADIKLDFSDAETVEEKVKGINKSIEDASGITAKYGVDTTEFQAAADIIDYLIEQKKLLEYDTILKVDTTKLEGVTKEVFDAVNDFIEKKAELDSAVKTYGEDSTQAKDAKTALEEAIKAIQGIDGIGANILESLGITPDKISSAFDIEEITQNISTALQNVTFDTLVNEIGIAEEAIYGLGDAATTLQDKNVTIDLTINGFEKLVAALGAYNQLEDKEVTVTIDKKDDEDKPVIAPQASGALSGSLTATRDAIAGVVADLEKIQNASANITFNVAGDEELADAIDNIEKLSDTDVAVTLGVTGGEDLSDLLDDYKELVDKAISISVNASSDETEGIQQIIQNIQDAISEVEELAIEISVDSSDADAALDVINQLIDAKTLLEYRPILSVDTSVLDGEISDAIDLMQDFIRKKADLEKACSKKIAFGGISGIEEARDEIDSLVEAISEIDPSILEDFQLDGDNINVDSISEALQNLSFEDLSIKLNVDTSALGNAVNLYNQLKDKTTTVTISMVGMESLISAVAYYNSLQDKTVTITINVVKNGGEGGTGGASGTAHASGTALSRGTAMASGDWGTAKPGRTLVGELGREIVVDPHTGLWYTVGDSGAEFVNMPGGAIVFNHLQTKHLLENGYVTSRGKAMAEGTAMANPGISGSITPSPSLRPSGSGGYSGGNYGGSGSGNYYGSDPKKSGKSEFEKEYDRWNHLLNMEQARLREYLDWLDSAYQQAYAAGQIELEDYYKYQEEIYDKQKELFEDSLTDAEHQILGLGRTDGNEAQIINIYLDMIKSLEQRIKEAKAYGLNENDEYIQELTEKIYDYQDEIKDIQEESLDDAKDAVEDLVEYRIKMLEQDLKNEKTALKDKLSELKDFYKKQKDLLEDERDEEEYLEEQAEKRKVKDDIETELKRLELDNSAWAEKRKLELKEELANAEKELTNFEKDRTLDKAKDLLDDLYERQEKQFDSQIEAIEKKLDDPHALYNQALADIQNNTLALYEEMVEYNNKYKTGNPEDVKEMWDEAKKSLDKYFSTFGEAYKNIILTPLPSGYASGTPSATPGAHAVDEVGPEYVFTSGDGVRYRVFSGGEKVLNAKATNFLYGFANSGEKILSTIFEKIVSAHAASQIANANHISEINMGDIIIQGNANESTVSEIRRAKRDEMQWILKEFNKMNKRS